MSTPTILTPPAASPNYPPPAISATDPVVQLTSETFTAEELQFMESVFWYWEENCPLAKPFENSDPNDDGYDPALALLTDVRAKLAALKPAVTS